MRSNLLLGGLLASVMIVPAIAQSNPPVSTTPPAAAVTTPAPATVAHSDMWRSSKLIGLNVYNDQNEKLGDINEILLDKSGKVGRRRDRRRRLPRHGRAQHQGRNEPS